MVSVTKKMTVECFGIFFSFYIMENFSTVSFHPFFIPFVLIFAPFSEVIQPGEKRQHNFFDIRLPDSAVKDSEKCEVSIIGKETKILIWSSNFSLDVSFPKKFV